MKIEQSLLGFVWEKVVRLTCVASHQCQAQSPKSVLYEVIPMWTQATQPNISLSSINDKGQQIEQRYVYLLHVKLLMMAKMRFSPIYHNSHSLGCLGCERLGILKFRSERSFAPTCAYVYRSLLRVQHKPASCGASRTLSGTHNHYQHNRNVMATTWQDSLNLK